MTLPVTIAPEAQADIRHAFRSYEDQELGLGHRCLAEMATTFRRIEWFPRGYQLVDGDVRAAPVHAFPFRVYYRNEAAKVYVIAVLADRGDPQLTADRLGKLI